MKSIHRFGILCCLAAGGLAPVPAAAHSDLLVARQGSQLVTGETDFGSGTIGRRVFSADLSSFGGGWTTGSPGFAAIGNQSLLPAGIDRLPGGEVLEFSLPSMLLSGTSTSGNLWYWDGAGEVAFTAPPTGHVFRLAGLGGQAQVDGVDLDVPGFPIAMTSSTGSIHQHIEFQLDETNAATPVDGLYLFSMTLSMAGLEDAEPVFFVFNKGLSGMLREQGVAWVETYQVPEPAAGTLAAMAFSIGLAVCRHTRRRARRRPGPCRSSAGNRWRSKINKSP